MGITPSDTPSSPGNYAQVTPHGQGPAPYSIQAPMSDGEIGGAFSQANADGGQGALYPMSPRATQAKTLMESPQGFGSGGFDVDAGATAGWPNNVEPPDGDPHNGGYGGA